jgi:hypothetical protein
MKLIAVFALILSGVTAQDILSPEELKAGIDSGACELTTVVSAAF